MGGSHSAPVQTVRGTDRDHISAFAVDRWRVATELARCKCTNEGKPRGLWRLANLVQVNPAFVACTPDRSAMAQVQRRGRRGLRSQL